MGSAKRTRSETQKFLVRHPVCCFCGGSAEATSRDHITPRQMFFLKLRPQGLEFPACENCNSRTKHAEQVACFLGRLLPDSANSKGLEEFGTIVRRLQSYSPEIIAELNVLSDKQLASLRKQSTLLPGQDALNVSGPRVNDAMQIFGSKMALTFQYQMTGLIVPPSGAVAVRWFSNHDLFLDRIPEAILRFATNPQTLKQGRWNVRDQFLFDIRATPDNGASMHYATFRNSFAVLSAAWMKANDAPNIENMILHRPGYWNDNTKPSA